MQNHFRVIVGVLCALLIFSQTARAQEESTPISPVFCTPAVSRFDGEANSKAIMDCAKTDAGFVVVTIPVGGPYFIRRTVSVKSDRAHMVIIRSTVFEESAKLISDPLLDGPILDVRGTDFSIFDIETDGNKIERDYSPTSSLQLCGRSDRRPANIEVHGLRFFVFRVKTYNAPCGSGLGVFGHGVFSIYQVTSENNGWPHGEWPFLPFQFADGITVVSCNGGSIYDNLLIDNTDFDLLSGGGPCQVVHNRIYHYNVFGFGGINLGFMTTGDVDPLSGKSLDGNHAKSLYAYNEVYSRRNKLMYGLSIGSHPFSLDAVSVTLSDGGTFIENSSSGAQINLAIDGVQIADVRRNHLDNPQGDRTEFNWCAVSMNYLAGHIGFVPQPGFAPLTIDLGQSTKNGNVCKP